MDMKAYTFEGENGLNTIEHEIPEEFRDQAEEYREIMIEKVAMSDDDLAEKYLA